MRQILTKHFLQIRKPEKANIFWIILSNWTAAKYRLQHKAGVMVSSMEGHVSQLLSERLSSRTMGWSTVEQIQRSKKNRHGEMGKYIESISHHISIQNKKSHTSTLIYGDGSKYQISNGLPQTESGGCEASKNEIC